jgi:predicted ribosomally synthesized peptide with SipW-like signal peptide
MSLKRATAGNTHDPRKAMAGHPRRTEVKARKEAGKARKLLLTVIAVGGLSALIGLGTYSAFTATTTNSGNSITSGTVKIDQHTGATTLYNVTNRKPGDSTTACVRVTYSGSLTATAVKLYTSAVTGSNFNLEIDRGSGMTTLDNTMSCAGFTQSSVAYNGDLGSLGTTYGTGVDGKASAATWANTDSVDYRFIITQNDDTTANAHTSTVTSGSHTFTWEARS